MEVVSEGGSHCRTRLFLSLVWKIVTYQKGKPGFNLMPYKILSHLGLYTDRPKRIMQSA